MRRLHTRIYLHLIGVLFVVGLATAAVFTSGVRTAFWHQLTERLVKHGAALVGDRFGDPTGRRRSVRRLAEEMDLDITVRDSDGHVLTVVGQELPELSEEDAQAVRAGGAVTEHFGKRWFAAAPILDDNGRLVGLFEASPIRRPRQPSMLRPIALVVLVLGLVGVATVPLARRISRPVERLTEASRRLGGGDLGYRVPVFRWRSWRRHQRRDELEELTRAWNEMAERIERLVRGQKELLANVSHELRSPLARIRMALELLPRDASGEARIADIAEDLDELDSLIEDVLTASRLEATGMPAHLASVELAPLLAGIVERAGHDPHTAGKEVRVAAGEPLVITADVALLKRALWNLVENAAKYGAAPITLSATREGGRVLLAVSDEGAGIPKDERARVLAPFYRADKARTPGDRGDSPRGFGLGLTIARGVAEVHGGSIRVEPARVEGGVERGCRITLDVPVEPAADKRAATA